MSVPTFGKSYLGDTTLSSKKFDQLTIVGVANLDAVIAKDISITGPLKASNITTDTFSVTGPVSLTDVTSDTVTITGYSEFTNVSVSKSLTITGMLNAKRSVFNAITLTMSESVLADSSAKSIVVKHPNSDEARQKLMLYGNSHIDTVEFESGQGEVHLYGANAKVANVKGAEVIQH